MAATTSLKSLVRMMPYILIIAGVIGIIASVIITVEKFDLIQNPSYHPACDLNPVVSCGSVMESKQASAFGFMNTYIGIVGFPILLTIGVAMLAGAKFKRWFWRGLQVGLTLGMVFAYWLLYQSVYNIHALCPYCLSVDVVLTIAFWYTTLYNIEQGVIKVPKGKWQRAAAFVRRHHLDILILWFLIILALILKHFWYYYGKHFF